MRHQALRRGRTLPCTSPLGLLSEVYRPDSLGSPGDPLHPVTAEFVSVKTLTWASVFSPTRKSVVQFGQSLRRARVPACHVRSASWSRLRETELAGVNRKMLRCRLLVALFALVCMVPAV